MLYELAKHPGIQEKVHKQVTSVLGDENEITGDMLQRMPYLGQVIKEAQRLVPLHALLLSLSFFALQNESS